MNKIINTLIFSIGILLLSAQLNAAPILLTQDRAITLSTTATKPVTISTNFEISDANLIVLSDKHASLTLLKKGFILIPKRSKYKATVVVVARNGAIYTINMNSGGKKAVFRVEDPIQDYDKQTKKFNFESGKMDQDARNMIKAFLLNKPISGFKKSNVYQKTNNGQFSLERVERHTGGKYILDKWILKNTSHASLYFAEEDFYTNGILAVALEKNRLLQNEEIFLILILNKNSIYENELRSQR